MDTVCGTCGSGLLISRAGATYCSTACRMKAYRKRKKLEANQPIPQAMREAHRWMRWGKISRRGKSAKRPITIDGRPGSSTDPRTWAGFTDTAASSVGHGVGFALGAGFACIDLDGALDETGAVMGWARPIVASAPDTFIEVSQSGRGLHIFGYLPEGRGRNMRHEAGGIEIYSSGRFIAMTGDRFGGSPSVLADLSELVDSIL